MSAEPTAGHDRIGDYVDYGSYRAGMPDATTALQAAAAGQMLEALRFALQVLESYRTTTVGAHSECIERVKAAITKAEQR